MIRKLMNRSRYNKRFTKTDFIKMLANNSHFSLSYTTKVLSILIKDNFINNGCRGPHALGIYPNEAAKLLMILMSGSSVTMASCIFESMPEGLEQALVNIFMYYTEAEKVESFNIDGVNFTATIYYKSGDHQVFGEVKKYQSRVITEINGDTLNKLSIAIDFGGVKDE